MRHPLSHAASVAAILLFGAALFGSSANAQKKKPVGVPPAAAAPEAKAEAAAEEAAPAPARKRPVVVPGAEFVAPPPVVDGESVVEQKEAQPEKAPQAPAADAPPPEFQGLPVAGAEDATAKVPVLDPEEARTSTRLGNFQYLFSVRPGRPKAGTPVEVSWRIQEILMIPDPFLGDRKPVEPVKLIATVSSPEGSRRYEVHALDAPGSFGIHFTPAREGAYQVQLERADRKPGHQLQSVVWVGKAPPPVDAAKGSVHDRSEELIAGQGPDDRTVTTVMAELGKRWMALERSVGTPDAEAAMAALQEQVAKVAGKVPAAEEAHALEFDELARNLAQQVTALTSKGTDRNAALLELQRIQNVSCMRCHARFRFGIAESVRGWPQFELKQDLNPLAPELRDAPRRGRGPVAPTGR